MLNTDKDYWAMSRLMNLLHRTPFSRGQQTKLVNYYGCKILITMHEQLRQFILETLQEAPGISDAHLQSRDDDLLVEPDFSADTDDSTEKHEQSVAGAVAGFTLPLGMQPAGKKRKPARWQ